MWQGFCRCARSARSITVRTRRLPTLRAGTVGFERAPRLTLVSSTPQRVGSHPSVVARSSRKAPPGRVGIRDLKGAALTALGGAPSAARPVWLLASTRLRFSAETGYGPRSAQRNAIPFRGQVTTLFAGNPMRASRSDTLGSGRLPGEALHLRAIPALLSNA